MSELRRVNPFRCKMWDLHDRLGENPRDQAYLTLLNSIADQGQKQPVLGRDVRDGSEFDIELIYGARRLAAAKELAVDILVEVRQIDDQEAAIEMDIENRVRQDISPYERGLSYRRWLRAGLFSTQAEIAKALAISEAQVCRLLKYSELPAAVIGAFGSPAEIREEWAGTLVSLCKDSSSREGVLRRARATTGKPASPQAVYENLVTGTRGNAVRSRARDEIVRGRNDQPLFRVRVRTKDVHLILPRDAISHNALTDITELLRVNLDSA